MSLNSGRTKLASSLKELRARWDRIRMSWDDPVARRFEKEFVAPLEGKVRSGATAMEEMGQLLGQIRRDCR